MMVMDDAIENTIRLMDAEGDRLSLRSSYNMAGISFTAEELHQSIKKYLPDFSTTYKYRAKRLGNENRI